MPRPSSSLAMCVLLAWPLLGCGTSSKHVRPGEDDGLTAHRNPYTFHRSVVHTLLKTGRSEKAVPHIRRMLDTRPESPEPHYLLARAFLAMKLFVETSRALDRALKRDKEYAPAHGLRGVMFDTQKKHKQAEKSHRRAVKLAPKDMSYQNNLGFCLYLQGRYDDAIEVYRKALILSPADPRIHNNLAFALARAGQKKLALKHFKLGGDEAQAHNNMGVALEMDGQLDRAYAQYLRAVASDSKLTAAQDNLTRVSKKLGRPVPRVLPLNVEHSGAKPSEGVRN